MSKKQYYFCFLRRSLISSRSAISAGFGGRTSSCFFHFFTTFSPALVISLITKKIEKAIIRKSNKLCRNFPYAINTSPPVIVDILYPHFVKSTPQTITQTAGVITSATSDETIFQNAVPMTTQTAISITFPFIAKALNSQIIFI